MDRIVSVSTMAFDGYSLGQALDELAELGVKCVEPASVDKIFQHLVDPFDDETGLLRGAVILAGTPHVAEGAHIELRLYEPLPCFNGKEVGLAGDVLLLKRGQERGGNFHPEESVDSGTDRSCAQELANSLDIRNTDFVDKIGLHGVFSRCERSA